MKSKAIALAVIISVGAIAPAHAEAQKNEDSCPVVPPVIQTIYVDKPVIQTVYVDKNVTGPTVYINKNVFVSVPVPAPTVYVHTPAREVMHTIYRTQFTPTDKAETIIALAKAQYDLTASRTAYKTLRAKYLALIAVEKKEK